MDGYDIFQKLIFGTSFDRRKRRRKKHFWAKRKAKLRQAQLEKEEGESKPADTVNCLSENYQVIDEDSTKEPAAVIKLKKKKVLSVAHLAQIKKEEVAHFRKKNHIHVEGNDIPDPIQKFDELLQYGINSKILMNLIQAEYLNPTPIQMQAIPLLIHERQVLACAPTGSGKTAAFLVPILHSLKGPQNVGIRALVLAPTRELAKQIYEDCVRLAKGTNLRPHIIHKVKVETKKLKPYTKYDILISTPNRLIYMLQNDPPLISLEKVQWFIVDESDKLFETGKQGFRDQLATVYKACDSVYVKRAMFSATFSHDVENWCKMNLDGVVSVSIGERNTAAETVEQELVYCGCEGGKLLAFRNLVRKGLLFPVLVFVQSKERARELLKELIYDGIYVDVIHSERTQLQRDNVVRSFRAGKLWVLICTELMARGIDFRGVNLVINYDFPPTAISYIHRIGRTGRAGETGKAITFHTDDDLQNLRSIAQVMKNAGCEVPETFLRLKRKRKRRNVVPLPVKRKSISTTPHYIEQQEAKRRKAIENSNKKKRQGIGKSQS